MALQDDPNLSSPSAPTTDAWPPDPSSSDVAHAKRLGDYLLLERIGEGGMAVVYKAQQTEPVQRIVALKLLKLGEESDVVARFQSERQALAILDHTNIARIFDAGTSPAGRPYFVMEYVDGLPITRFCDRQRLSIEQRLRLFSDVCHAVQHAHFKGIVHRDLKPSNVLVSNPVMGQGAETEPIVKVIDFGIAKAIEADLKLSDRTLHTQQGLLIGTPEYMSPEQASGAADVDTRTDVFSLGVLLYELLSGTLPFDRAMATARATATATTVAAIGDPRRPSAACESLPDGPTVAAARGTDPASLCRCLRGDLDLIVLKAMQEDRARRYATPAALAEDVRRHLRHEPIAARPPTLAYQARRFAQRNQVLVSASAMVLAAIVLGGIVTAIALVRARQALAREAQARVDEARQRAEAESSNAAAAEVSGFLADMLQSVHPQLSHGKPVLVRDVLDKASSDLADRFNDQPVVKSSLHNIIATTYHALGLFPEALVHAQAALDLRLRLRGPDHPETLESMNNVATLLESLGRNREAEPLRRELLARRRTVLGPEDRATLAAEDTLAVLLHNTDRSAEAAPLAHRALEVRRRKFGERDPDTLTSLNDVGSIEKSLGHVERAESLYRAAFEGRRSVLGEDSPETLISQNNLGAALLALKRLPDAEALLRDLVQRSERVQGPEHPRTLTYMNNLAATLNRSGNGKEAVALLRDIVARRKRSLPAEHPETLQALANLGVALEGLGKLDEALHAYGEAYKGVLASELAASRKARYASAYGLCLLKARRLAEAEPPLTNAMRWFEQANMTADARAAAVLNGLAQIDEAMGRAQQAAEHRARAAQASTGPATAPTSDR